MQPPEGSLRMHTWMMCPNYPHLQLGASSATMHPALRCRLLRQMVRQDQRLCLSPCLHPELPAKPAAP